MHRATIRTAAQVSEIVRARRHALGLSQAEVGAVLGIQQGRYSTLEANAGQLSLERLLLLCAKLGLELSIEDKPTSTSPASEW
ncbi:MAG: helix-turn-helix transcriptional regulator [Polyangiales bacterium]